MTATPDTPPTSDPAVSGGPTSTRWIWLAILAVVVVVGVLAFVLTRSDGSGSGGQSTSSGTVVPSGKVTVGTITVTGNPLADRPSTGADTAVGQPIPTITGETFDGSTVTIAPDDGPAVIMVVAHWCPHCQREVPFLQTWLNTNGQPEGVRLVAIATANTASRPNYPAGDWLVREKWTVPTMVDDENGDAAAALGVTGFPFFVAVDAQGRVVERASGELTAAQWESLITAARTGTAQPGA